MVRDAARNAEPLRPELLRVLEVFSVGLQRVDRNDDANSRVDGDVRAWQRVGADAAARQETQGWVETHALSGRCSLLSDLLSWLTWGLEPNRVSHSGVRQ